MKNLRASALRRALSAHVPSRGKRYDIALKARVIAFAQARRGAGERWEIIADELGLRFETLRRWCVGRSPSHVSRAMRAVEVVAERSTSMAIVSPSGVRIEGVTLDEAIGLLRALG